MCDKVLLAIGDRQTHHGAWSSMRSAAAPAPSRPIHEGLSPPHSAKSECYARFLSKSSIRKHLRAMRARRRQVPKYGLPRPRSYTTQAHIADRSETVSQRMRPRWSETYGITYIRVPMRASALAYTVHLWIGTPSCPREQGSRRRTRVRSLDRVPVQRHEASCYTVMLPCSMVYNFEPEVPISETKHRRAEAEEDAIAQ